MDSKIIVYGFSRTGTSSLEIALQNLGFNTINVDMKSKKT